jgi:hypothetical protein
VVLDEVGDPVLCGSGRAAGGGWPPVDLDGLLPKINTLPLDKAFVMGPQVRAGSCR